MFSSQANAGLQKVEKPFSLESYLSYIGLDEFKPSDLSLEALTTIIEHHIVKFIYRNTAIFEAGKCSSKDRKIPDLNIDNLFNNMLENHGGYCFQHLELMFAALTELGFRVDRLLAKIILIPYSKLDFERQAQPKTHELLLIHYKDKPYIVDVGMGNLCLRKPLELKEGEQRISNDQYRLTRQNDLWTLDTKTDKSSEWFCLYQFYNSPVQQAEVAKAHQTMYLTDQRIGIRDDMLLIGRTTLEKRKHLVWHTKDNGFGIFKSVKLNGDEKTKEFATLEEATAFARKKFGVV